MRLPELPIPLVCHIGTLRACDKGVRGGSYEGHGLSVSLHPDEWERIARLGGLPWHRLSKPDGRFVDAHALTVRHRRAIAAWAVARGLAARKTVWRYERYDDELEDTLIFQYDSKAEAVEQAELEDIEPAEVRRATALAGTRTLALRLGMDSGPDAFDHLLVCYVEDEHPDFDGIWWQDAHLWLSAPRGVILPGRLADWSTAQVADRYEWDILLGDD